jgi:Cu+-exporting ATPase
MIVEKKFYIRGMHCAACSAGSERVMRKQRGVLSAEVNLAAETAAVSYDTEQIKLSQIKNAVERLGYSTEDYEDAQAQTLAEERKLSEHGRLRRRLTAAVAAAVPLLYVSMGHMLPVELPLPEFLSMSGSPLNFALIQFALTVLILAAGRDFYASGVRSLAKLVPNMDTLVAVGTGSAFLYSCYALVRILLGHKRFVHAPFFESAAVVVTLVMLGKYLEAGSKNRTSEAIQKLTKLAPDRAFIEKDGERIDVEASELAVGDIVVVLPGGRFPCDGEVVAGRSTADNSMLTGESLPVALEAGTRVTGGSVNGEGLIKFRATEVGGDTALSHIIRMVRDAQGKKAPIAKIADRVAAYFVPAVMGLAVISAAVWAAVGKDAEFVLNTFVSVLVIACPCALGLATPTAIMAGTGRGAQLGVLFKSGEALQAASGITHVALDKTGTLTEGKPAVIFIKPAEGIGEEELLSLAASLEQGSEHPAARAIINEAEKRGLELRGLDSVTALPGRGVEAEIGGAAVYVGNEKLMREKGVDIAALSEHAEPLLARGAILMYCGAKGRPLGLLAASDRLKPDGAEAVRRLHSLGLKVTMLTGDNEAAAGAIAASVGLDSYLAGVLPGDKAETVGRLRAAGEKIAMVGDGINDAPALAAADVGIALAGGTDIAVESADVVLVGSSLSAAADALSLARAVMRNVKQNLFWAFFYNCVGIPFAAGVFYAFGGPRLDPAIAGGAMALSSVCVVGNALRLKRFRPKY